MSDTCHPADDLAHDVHGTLRHAGFPVDHGGTRRVMRRWWATGRLSGVPLGYVVSHHLPIERDTLTRLNHLGAEASRGGGARD